MRILSIRRVLGCNFDRLPSLSDKILEFSEVFLGYKFVLKENLRLSFYTLNYILILTSIDSVDNGQFKNF